MCKSDDDFQHNTKEEEVEKKNKFMPALYKFYSIKIQSKMDQFDASQ